MLESSLKIRADALLNQYSSRRVIVNCSMTLYDAMVRIPPSEWLILETTFSKSLDQHHHSWSSNSYSLEAFRNQFAPIDSEHHIHISPDRLAFEIYFAFLSHCEAFGFDTFKFLLRAAVDLARFEDKWGDDMSLTNLATLSLTHDIHGCFEVHRISATTDRRYNSEVQSPQHHRPAKPLRERDDGDEKDGMVLESEPFAERLRSGHWLGFLVYRISSILLRLC